MTSSIPAGFEVGGDEGGPELHGIRRPQRVDRNQALRLSPDRLDGDDLGLLRDSVQGDFSAQDLAEGEQVPKLGGRHRVDTERVENAVLMGHEVAEARGRSQAIRELRRDQAPPGQGQEDLAVAARDVQPGVSQPVRGERDGLLKRNEQVQDDDLASRTIRFEDMGIRGQRSTDAVDGVADRRDLGGGDGSVNHAGPPRAPRG